MGQYIQIGVCTKIAVAESELSRYANPSAVDDLLQSISARPLDLTLFDRESRFGSAVADRRDAQGELRWSLREDVLNTGLLPFLRAQFLMVKDPLSPEQSQLLAALSQAKGHEPILKVVADQGRYMLHRLEHEESLPIGRWHHQRVRVVFEEIIFLTEGKALLECYNDLFRYLGHVIAQQRQQHPIAAATLVTIC